MQRIYKGTDIDTETDLSIIAYVYFKYIFFAFNGSFSPPLKEWPIRYLHAHTHTKDVFAANAVFLLIIWKLIMKAKATGNTHIHSSLPIMVI